MDLSVKQIQDRLFRTILEQSLHSIVFVDGHANVKIWNRSAEKLFGIGSQQAIGSNIFELVLPPDQVDLEQAKFEADARAPDEGPRYSEAKVRLANGMEIWVDQTVHHFQIGNQNWAYIEIRDAESRKRRESELQRVATTDELSQLINRRGFQQLLEVNLSQKLALAIVDVDHFKEINDSLGHEVGDEAIKFIANELSNFFKDPICVARLGGDEFGVVVYAENRGAIESLFNEFRTRIAATPFSTHKARLTLSIGVALSDRPGASARELLSTADRAMYLSKHAGRNRVTTISF